MNESAGLFGKREVDIMAPLESVIVPVYNAEQYIGKCIESIQSQT